MIIINKEEEETTMDAVEEVVVDIIPQATKEIDDERNKYIEYLNFQLFTT